MPREKGGGRLWDEAFARNLPGCNMVKAWGEQSCLLLVDCCA